MSDTQIVLQNVPQSRSTIRDVENRPGQVKRRISSTDRAARLLDWRVEMY